MQNEKQRQQKDVAVTKKAQKTKSGNNKQEWEFQIFWKVILVEPKSSVAGKYTETVINRYHTVRNLFFRNFWGVFQILGWF